MTTNVEHVRHKGRRKSPNQDSGGVFRTGQKRGNPLLFSTPANIGVTAILAFPVLYGVWQSLYRPEVLGAPAEWVGLQNYIDAFNDPDFSNALYRTTLFAGGSILLGTALGLFFSFALY